MQCSPFRIHPSSFILHPSALILSLALVLPGCGGGGPALAPVSGTVNYNGKPLAQGEISFHPAGGQRPAYGKIQDGKIVDVKTADKEGVIVGPCQVGVTSVQAAADMYTPSKSLIPQRYADPKKSGLSCEIKKGQTNQVEFELRD
jgi:hypothetical protein